jgi:hypothetical protein
MLENPVNPPLLVVHVRTHCVLRVLLMDSSDNVRGAENQQERLGVAVDFENPQRPYADRLTVQFAVR